VAGDEDHTEAVVVDLLTRHRAERRFVPVEGGMCLQLAPDLGVLCPLCPMAAKGVDRPALPHGGEPRTGVVWRPVAGPLADRLHRRVLSKVLGRSDVAGEGGQHRDHPGELDPVDGLDGGGRIG